MSDQASYRRRIAEQDATTEILKSCAVLAALHKQHGGNEMHPEVVAAKADLIALLAAKDRDVTSAVEKALMPLGIGRRNAWQDIDPQAPITDAAVRLAVGKSRVTQPT